MKKIGILFATIIMALLFVVSASALEPTGQCGDNVYWTYDSAKQEVVISGSGKTWNYNNDYYNGVMFYEAGSPFYNNDYIKSVVIEDGVTHVGMNLFRFCTGIRSVVIGDSVTRIAAYAFGSANLENLVIGKSLSSIGRNGTGNNKAGAKVYIKNIEQFLNIETDIYTVLLDGGAELYLNNILVTNLVIPESVKNIGWNLRGCSSLTSVTIPDNMQSISDRAFQGCSKLSEIVYPETISLIEEYAFSGCNFSEFAFSESISYIANYAFSGCKFSEIVLPESVSSIGEYAFYNCKNLEKITISDKTVIYSNSFENTKYYNDPNNWKDGVLYVGNCLAKAKEDISGSYIVRDGTKSIAAKAFYRCTSLETIELCNDLEIISREAFYYCNNLKKVIVGNNLKQIGNSAFRECSKLEDITLPDGVEIIGTYAFDRCISLASITIPGSVKAIYSYAFQNCTKLEKVIIGDGILVINGVAFGGCTNLKNLYLPSNISVSNKAFHNCNSIDNIYYAGDRALWEESGLVSNPAFKNATIHYSGCDGAYTSSVYVDVTCTVDGTVTHTCKCGSASYSEIITLAYGHNYESSYLNPSCTKIGGLYHTCSSCNDVYVTNEENALGHDMSEFVKISDSTCTVNGVLKSDCSRCDHYVTKNIVMTPHVESTWIIDSNETCTTDGLKHIECIDCETVLKTEVIKKSEHNYKDAVCTKCGYDRSETCSCNCHKSGFASFFWKITLFFNKLFKIKSKQICACGVSHY